MNKHEKPTNEEISHIKSRLALLKNRADNLIFILLVFYAISIIVAIYLNTKIVVALIFLLGILHYSFLFGIYEKFKDEFNAIKFENRNIKIAKEGVKSE